MPQAHVHLDHVLHAVQQEFLESLVKEASKRRTADAETLANMRPADCVITFRFEHKKRTEGVVARKHPDSDSYGFVGLVSDGAEIPTDGALAELMGRKSSKERRPS